MCACCAHYLSLGIIQPKMPIEVRLAAQGLPEAEIQRRKRISEAAKGRTAWNKGLKHSAGALPDKTGSSHAVGMVSSNRVEHRQRPAWGQA